MEKLRPAKDVLLVDGRARLQSSVSVTGSPTSPSSRPHWVCPPTPNVLCSGPPRLSFRRTKIKLKSCLCLAWPGRLCCLGSVIKNGLTCKGREGAGPGAAVGPASHSLHGGSASCPGALTADGGWGAPVGGPTSEQSARLLCPSGELLQGLCVGQH